MTITAKRRLCGGAVLLGAVCCLTVGAALWRYQYRRIPFHQWHAATRSWSLVKAIDAHNCTVVIDKPTNSLLLCLGGKGFVMTRGSPTRIGMHSDNMLSFASFHNDLLIGVSNGTLHHFTLQPDCAERVFSGVEQRMIDDAAEAVLRCYSAIGEPTGLRDTLLQPPAE